MLLLTRPAGPMPKAYREQMALANGQGATAGGEEAGMAAAAADQAGGSRPWACFAIIVGRPVTTFSFFVLGSPHVTLIELRLAPHFVPGLTHFVGHSRRPERIRCARATTQSSTRMLRPPMPFPFARTTTQNT